MKQLNKESRATRLLAAIIFGTESKMNVLSKISSFSDQIHQKASYKALILGKKLQIPQMHSTVMQVNFKTK